MYDCIVSDAHIISDNGLGFFKSAMDHGAILHIYLVAHADAVHIAPYHGIEPHTAVVAHDNITYNGGIGSYKTIGAHDRADTIYRK
jgi:hypothetical protein